MYRANGSVYWQHDQHISIDLFGDYAATGSALKCNFSGSLVSTVYDIPSLSTSFNHSHTTNKADTNLYIMVRKIDFILVLDAIVRPRYILFPAEFF